MRMWRWVVNWWRGPLAAPSPETERARERLDEVCRDDARVDRLDRRTQRARRENNLGPAISRALRARRP